MATLSMDKTIDKSKVKAAFVQLPSIPNGTELVFDGKREDSPGWGTYGRYANDKFKVCIPAARITNDDGNTFPSKIQIVGPDKFREIE